ncbi:MAG: ATP-binding protein, partial [Limisphaerales bacterium]
IDGIPSIVIDPKGDLGNLLLTFPGLRPEDFAPWVNEEDAQKARLSVADFAAQQAELWRKGLASWDQDGARIGRLRAAAEFALYTPGSRAGLPVSILSSFAPPPAEILEDRELLRERVNSTVASLLGLVGGNADPVKSRECILLSTLLQQAWVEGRVLDLAALIHEVQTPPVRRIGVLDLEVFYPAKDRFELAMQLNNLLASPGFAAWSEGEPLDIGRLLYSPAGKPRVAIFSIAHLGDSERMFFVTLLLNQILGWMRSQSGTSSLRALVYMDEILGYFPPVANPPAKPPLLAMLKQGRAFGLGVVLATQNPVDLDYKGLANIGTWFIGRLQTERDKARVMEGLEGAAAGRGAAFDRTEAERIIAGLGSRVFLLHNVHEDTLQVFESRWALSYLRGPLSRTQIKALTAAFRDAPTVSSSPAPVASASTNLAVGSTRPVLPPQIPQFFVPVRSPIAQGSAILYQPRLLGAAQVRFTDSRLEVEEAQEITVMTEITDHAIPVDWAAAEELAITASDLHQTPTEGDYLPCAPAASEVKNYATWSKDFAAWIQNERRLTLFLAPAFKQTSRPGENERDFRIRLLQTARESRDSAAERLRQKYAPKLASLQERLRRSEAARQREAEQASRAKLNTVISLGSTLLGAFLGRKAVSATTASKAASTLRSAGRAMDQTGDVTRAQETVEAVQQQLQDLESQFQAEVEALSASLNPNAGTLETVQLRPTRTNVNVRLVALVWLPFARDALGMLKPGY